MDITAIPFMQIFMIDIDDIKGAPFNPDTRTMPKNLRVLRDLIIKYGFRVPVQFSRDGILGDGHRRVACARSIGLKQIPAFRQDLSVDEVFELNNGARKITDKELLKAYDNGFRNILAGKLSRLQTLRDLIGEDGIHRLAEKDISIFILSMARMVTNYCQIDDNDFTRRCIWWLVDYKQQFMVRRAIGGGIAPEVLERAVNEGKKIAQRWDAA